MGEVVGPHGGGGVTGVQVDDDADLAGGEVDERAVLPDGRGPADLDTVDRDVEEGGRWVSMGSSPIGWETHVIPFASCGTSASCPSAPGPPVSSGASGTRSSVMS